MPEESYLTVEEVAKILGVHPDSVRRWIRNREIYAINLGGPAGYRISKAALDDFIRRRGNMPVERE
jgi:excisionase family DNA binding protein